MRYLHQETFGPEETVRFFSMGQRPSYLYETEPEEKEGIDWLGDDLRAPENDENEKVFDSKTPTERVKIDDEIEDPNPLTDFLKLEDDNRARES